MKYLISILIFSSFTTMAKLPPSDILVADLSVKSSVNDSLLAIKNLQAVTNAPNNYDNQPLFLADGESLLYTSAVEVSSLEDNETEQTDSFSYNLNTGVSKNLTNSPASEYSPTLMPSDTAFSVIKAFDDQQKFWQYPLNGDQPSELLKEVNPVGYHAWVDDKSVILFVLGEPHTLQLANVSTQTVKVLDADIGASLYKIPNSHLMSYSAADNKAKAETAKGEAENEPTWQLKSYDPQTGDIKVLTQLPKSAYYYGWSGDQKAIAAQGSKLMQWDMHKPNNAWKVFADVSEQCPKGITRLTVNQQNTKILLVCTR